MHEMQPSLRQDFGLRAVFNSQQYEQKQKCLYTFTQDEAKTKTNGSKNANYWTKKKTIASTSMSTKLLDHCFIIIDSF